MNQMILYTDGACSGNPGPGAWAYVLYDGAETVYERAASEARTTNNRMEMSAAIEALEFLAEKKTSPSQKILILIDSSYVVFGITQWIYGWQKRGWKTMEGADVNNRELWERLWNVARKFTALEWKIVPGHSGMDGNERCDELAVFCQKNQTSVDQAFSLGEYRFKINVIPDFSKYKKLDPYYLSLVNGVLAKHATWGECEARVRGRPGAKFKKVKNLNDEELVMKSWGVLLP